MSFVTAEALIKVKYCGENNSLGGTKLASSIGFNIVYEDCCVDNNSNTIYGTFRYVLTRNKTDKNTVSQARVFMQNTARHAIHHGVLDSSFYDKYSKYMRLLKV